MRPVMLFLPLQSGLKRGAMAFKPEGMEAFTYRNDATLGLMGIKASPVRVAPFRRHDLAGIGFLPTKP